MSCIKPAVKPAKPVTIRIAEQRIFEARSIGWKALEKSWQATLDALKAQVPQDRRAPRASMRPRHHSNAGGSFSGAPPRI